MPNVFITHYIPFFQAYTKTIHKEITLPHIRQPVYRSSFKKFFGNLHHQKFQEHKKPVFPQASIPLRSQLCPNILNSHTPYYSQICCLPALNHEEKVQFQKSSLAYQIPFLLQSFNCHSVSHWVCYQLLEELDSLMVSLLARQ